MYQKTWKDFQSDYRKLNCLSVSLIILFSLGIGLIWKHILTDNKGIVRAGVATLKETTIESLPLNDICTLNEVYCDNSIEGIITKSALKYGVDPDLMIRIAKAESSLNPKAIGKITPEDRGLFQINSTWHLKDDDACAFDAYCSSEWTAKKISMGGIGLWNASKHNWNN